MSVIDLSLNIATKAHTGQQDIYGNAFILHPIAVGMMGKTDEERCTGFLHHVIDNANYTAEDLLEVGIPNGIVNAIKTLTHQYEIEYYAYIQEIIDSNNPIALKVIYNDIKYNYFHKETSKILEEKYGKALAIIESAIININKVSLFNIDSINNKNYKTVIFAAGCFWGVQHYFKKQKGVVKCYVGYTGGTEDHPTYDKVRSHDTKHVEAILVVYDPTIVSYTELCKLFFEIHNPAQTDGQGPDIGQQYRSVAFYNNEQEHMIIEQLISILRNKLYVVNTLVKPSSKFWIAENYHQNYYENTGGSPYCHIKTKKF